VPGVKAKVMVVAAGGNERRRVAVHGHQFESEDAAVKLQRTVDARDLEVDVANVRPLGDGAGSGVFRV
jgi:hypothetical protein